MNGAVSTAIARSSARSGELLGTLSRYTVVHAETSKIRRPGVHGIELKFPQVFPDKPFVQVYLELDDSSVVDRTKLLVPSVTGAVVHRWTTERTEYLNRYLGATVLVIVDGPDKTSGTLHWQITGSALAGSTPPLEG